MAENKSTSTNKGTVIEVVGPKDENNGAQLFLLRRDGKKDDLQLAPGDRVTVGEDVTKEEAERLLKSATWKFQTVTK